MAAHRHHGVEPICRVLSTEDHQIAPSSVRYALARPSCARRLEDDELMVLIAQIFVDNYEVYGARKIKAALKREHRVVIDRARVTRLMSELDIRGAARTRTMRTTRPDKSSPRAPDLVKRQFTAEHPNELWVSDFTYVPTWSGFVYVAFIIDVYSRFVVGWRVSSSMTTDLVMDALEMAVFNRRTRLINDVITHSDAGSQGGFNWSSQHLDEEVVDGQASWMDEGADGTVADEVAGRSVASTRDRARVLETRYDRDHERGRSSCSRGVPGRRESLVPAWWRHATNGPETWIGPLSVVR